MRELAVRQKDRIQTMGQLYQNLYGVSMEQDSFTVPVVPEVSQTADTKLQENTDSFKNQKVQTETTENSEHLVENKVSFLQFRSVLAEKRK